MSVKDVTVNDMMVTGGPERHFLVRRADLRQWRWHHPERSAPPAAGQIQVAVEKFAFTANNITYARLGESARYWDFFPASEGWGSVPVWGYGRVVASRHDGVTEGERVYGYFPMSSHVLLTPDQVTPGRFLDGAAHRVDLARTYNEYTRVAPVGKDSPAAAEQENRHLVLRPLFSLSFFLADWLVEQGGLGAERILISSASSKTAIGLAFLLTSSHRLAANVVGLTSPNNRDFVAGLNSYDRVLCYDQLAGLEPGPTLYVDIAGDAGCRAAVHRHFRDRLVHSCRVGFTHWETSEPSLHAREPALPGPAPELFFTPTRILQRRQEWGAQRLGEAVRQASERFYQHAGGWLRIDESRGDSAVEHAYASVLEGRTGAQRANVIYW